MRRGRDRCGTPRQATLVSASNVRHRAPVPGLPRANPATLSRNWIDPGEFRAWLAPLASRLAWPEGASKWGGATSSAADAAALLDARPPLDFVSSVRRCCACLAVGPPYRAHCSLLATHGAPFLRSRVFGRRLVRSVSAVPLL